ncbi:MAG: 30S ribosomal protein S16 [Sphingobacteriia bacterium]|nr:30S ribosomal protein S16 [Sphingobacteriia bacterium]
MPTKIRLQRHGKKGRPFYHIVIADGRAPRDGRFIERIGTYNPVAIPAEIDLDFDRALYWVRVGAQPSDTVRALLSFKGVMYKNHLLKGVDKKALTLEEAEVKFSEWLEAKKQRFINSLQETENKKRQQQKKALEEETRIKEERAAEIAKKRAEEIEKKVKAAQEKAAEAAKNDAAEDEPANEAE